MTLEENLKEIINKEYHSIWDFAIAAEIPYETVVAILKRGVNKATFSNISKICHTLQISIDGLCNGIIVPVEGSRYIRDSGYPRYVYVIFPHDVDGRPVGAYVGAAQNVDDRIYQHLNTSKNDKHGQKELHDLMRENGYTLKVIDVINSYDEIYKEYDWIDLFVRLNEMKIFNHRVGNHADFRRVMRFDSQAHFEEWQRDNEHQRTQSQADY